MNRDKISRVIGRVQEAYGLSGPVTAAPTTMTEQEARAASERFFAAHPRLAAWLEKHRTSTEASAS